ncbi:hypothetical protein ACT1U9_02230 [Streptomyces sp. BR1]|uniref:hypothetical protein n=1 Tax=Streptomyces sp. BR1 TaxID=1592323 RepID=UPI00402BB142
MPRRTPMRISLGLSAPALRLLADGLRGSGGPLRRIAGWSVLEAAPALASGWVTAAALDHGFLAGRPGVGLAWIALLAGLFFARAAAERALFTPLAEVVENLRDTLVRRVVRGVLERATADGRGGGSTAVAQLNGQMDTVRNLTGTLLRTARPLSVSLLAAVIGLAALDPLLAGLVLAPLVPALAVFFWSMRRLTTRRRLLVLAEEKVAGRGGVRRVPRHHGAGGRAARRFGRGAGGGRGGQGTARRRTGGRAAGARGPARRPTAAAAPAAGRSRPGGARIGQPRCRGRRGHLCGGPPPAGPADAGGRGVRVLEPAGRGAPPAGRGRHGAGASF